MNTKILLVSTLVIILVIGIFAFSGQNFTSNINNSSNSTNQNPSYVPVTNQAQNNSTPSSSQNNIQHQEGVPL